MNFTELKKFELCKLAYNVKEKQSPDPIIELFNSSGKKTHRYFTRYKNLPNIKKHKSCEYNNSFLCKSISYLKELSLNTVNLKTKKEFILKYKNHIFGKEKKPL